jgi:hypothetical protein
MVIVFFDLLLFRIFPKKNKAPEMPRKGPGKGRAVSQQV